MISLCESPLLLNFSMKFCNTPVTTKIIITIIMEMIISTSCNVIVFPLLSFSISVFSMNFIITKAIVATEIPKREERDPEIVIKKTNIAKKIRKVILNFFLVLKYKLYMYNEQIAPVKAMMPIRFGL
jgi:hypothetical protein